MRVRVCMAGTQSEVGLSNRGTAEEAGVTPTASSQICFYFLCLITSLHAGDITLLRSSATPANTGHDVEQQVVDLWRVLHKAWHACWRRIWTNAAQTYKRGPYTRDGHWLYICERICSVHHFWIEQVCGKVPQLNYQILQGNAATDLRRGGTFSSSFRCRSLLKITVKEYSTFVKIIAKKWHVFIAHNVVAVDHTLLPLLLSNTPCLKKQLLDLFLVRFSIIFLLVPCGGLSWLHVSFLLHVKYTISYRIVTPSIFLHNTYKYKPIWMKISDNIDEGMLNLMSENSLSSRQTLSVSTGVIVSVVTATGFTVEDQYVIKCS